MKEKEGPADAGLFDSEGAAAYLNTTRRHVRRLRSECRIRYVKIGGKLRFRRQDLDEYIAANTHDPAPDSRYRR